MAKFKGIECATIQDVESVLLDDMKLFMGGIDRQIQVLTEMLILHLASEHNKLGFDTCNIDGVTNNKTADERLVLLRDQIWGHRNSIKSEAMQFIKENDLK